MRLDIADCKADAKLPSLDATGNITTNTPGNTYTYDAEGRVIAVNNSASYVDDIFGERAGGSEYAD
jgi:YD repeat-containing protein